MKRKRNSSHPHKVERRNVSHFFIRPSKVKLILSLLIFIFFMPSLVLGSEITSKITFEKKKLVIGNKTLAVEVADTQEKRRLGLMNRRELPWDSGMIFIFDKESTQTFWMKNTFIDLSIGFFNKNQVLIDIQDMIGVKSVIQKEIPRVSSQAPAQFALEVNQGWFKKNKIKLGQKFMLVD